MSCRPMGREAGAFPLRGGLVVGRADAALGEGGAEQVADLVFRRVGDAVADAGPGFDEGRVAEFAA